MPHIYKREISVAGAETMWQAAAGGEKAKTGRGSDYLSQVCPRERAFRVDG